jgi:predicted amidohydrolase YtcJ
MLRSSLVFAWCAASALAQGLVLQNGRVWTGTAVEWAGPLVVVDGRIAKPGTAAPAGAETIDLQGAFVMPGLQDAHGHLLGLGQALEEVDLVGAKSYDEVIARVVAATRGKARGEWVVGRGWDQNLWKSKEMPHHADLSAETPDHPVWLVRVDGHAALANLHAMRLAGISKGVSAPSGGEILADASGEPTGVLVDKAMDLVALPEPDSAVVQRRLLRAQDECFRHGLTCVHDAGVSRHEMLDLQLLHKAGKWRLRAYEMWNAAELDAIRKGPWQSTDGLIQVRAVKGYADGALGSRGAVLLEPYADRPGHRGLFLTPVAGLRTLAQTCADAGMQLCTHAIGDAANRAVLDAYASVSIKSDRKALRFRIEHAQVVASTDFARFAELGVLPSMQPTHLTSDMPWAVARLGAERVKGAYAWKSFHALGLPVPFGSDFPVESSDPRRGIYAAVTTRPFAGGEPLRVDQQLDRARALRGFTADAAYAMFAEQQLGTIEAGKLADLTVFDRDLLTCPERELLEAKVLLTVVGGRVEFRAANR